MLCQLSYRGETLAMKPATNKKLALEPKGENKKNNAATWNRTQAAAATTRSPATRLFRRNCIWRIRVSIPVLNLAKVVCYHVQQSPMCVHRDSNPNLILGRDKYYPCTMDARCLPTSVTQLGNSSSKKNKKGFTTSAGFEPTRA